MRSRYSRGGGLSYSQQNFVDGFKSAGGVRDVVQPIVPPPVVNNIPQPTVEPKPETVPVIEELSTPEPTVEVVETATPTPTPQPTSTPEPTIEKTKEIVPTITSTPEPTVSVLRSIPTVKPTEKPIRTSNFKSKL